MVHWLMPGDRTCTLKMSSWVLPFLLYWKTLESVVAQLRGLSKHTYFQQTLLMSLFTALLIPSRNFLMVSSSFGYGAHTALLLFAFEVSSHQFFRLLWASARSFIRFWWLQIETGITNNSFSGWLDFE